MKKLLLLIFIATFSLNSTAQIVFEKGYFIDNTGNRTECLIKNVDWKNNPTSFEYKQSEDNIVNMMTINQATEFGVYNFSKYKKYTVNIDISSDQLQNLTYDSQPEMKEKVLFLNVLLEGKANLYEFTDDNTSKYFFNVDSSKVEQLVYKRYLVESSGNDYRKNSRYKQQLFNNLKCPNFSMQKINKVDYNRQDLVNFFVAYNQCNNEEVINYKEKQKRDLFNLNIRPGINNSSLSVVHNFQNYRDVDFENKWNFRLGIEAEFILPFNKDSWSIVAEPTYQSYKDERITNVTKITLGDITASVDYKAIEIPLSIRYYIFLNDKSKIFANVGYVINFTTNSSFIYSRSSSNIFDDLDINRTKNNWAIGLGYKLDDKYSIEFRYLTPREILGKYVFYDSKYKTVSIIFGYSIF